MIVGAPTRRLPSTDNLLVRSFAFDLVPGDETARDTQRSAAGRFRRGVRLDRTHCVAIASRVGMHHFNPGVRQSTCQLRWFFRRPINKSRHPPGQRLQKARRFWRTYLLI